MAKSQIFETTAIQELLAIRVQQLEQESDNVEAFRKKAGLAPSTYNEVKSGRGNPSLQTIAKIADGLKMSVFELLGVPDADVQRSLKKVGIDYQEIATAIAARNKAERRLAELRPGRKKASSP